MERLLRILQRLGFREATVFSSSIAQLQADLERASWARAELELKFRECAAGGVRVAVACEYCQSGGDRALVVSADYYCDERLLRALAAARASTLLVDSHPPRDFEVLWEGIASRGSRRFSEGSLVTHEWLSGQNQNALLRDALTEADESGEIALLDAATEPTYLRDQRASVRPVFFPAPATSHCRVAERVVQHAAQKGTLDIPAMVHAPIETWIVSKLWRTAIRPNHLSAVTMLVGLTVTGLYATGSLGWGVVLALAVGVLDGLDGKLARTKVETTEIGKWEHEVDYFVETTWGLALAYHFAAVGTVPHVWVLWSTLFVAEFTDRSTRGWIKKQLNRNLDDVTVFDRTFRLIGARRNIYTWIFALGLLLGEPAKAFMVICGWGITTAVIHVVRGVQIRQSLRARTA